MWMRQVSAMGTDKALKLHANESGVALLQVVFVGALLAISAYVFVAFITNSDKESLRMIRRNENLNFSTAISDFVSDSEQFRGAANVVDQIGAGAPVQYP